MIQKLKPKGAPCLVPISLGATFVISVIIVSARSVILCSWCSTHPFYLVLPLPFTFLVLPFLFPLLNFPSLSLGFLCIFHVFFS